ncbi:TRAP transporter small permease [Amorphus sp. MBR-141]
MFDEIESRLSRVSRASGIVGIGGLLLVAVLTVADILARWLLGAPLAGIDDVTKLAIIVVISACFSAGLFERRQIQIRFLGALLGRHASAVLDAFAALATTLMFVLITWQMGVYAGEVTQSGETTFLLRIPVGPIWWAATIFFGLCVPLQAVVALSDIARIPSGAARPTSQGRDHG